MSGIRVEGLSKSFNGTVANDGIDLAVESGEFRGIIGPNGSGKTTLFNAITGFLEPDAGRIVFDGDDITALSPDAIARRGLLRTFQITTPFENLTVRENMLSTYSGGWLSGVRIPEEKRARAAELLALLELERVADTEASDISGGQQKLLELGRVLMLEPDCVLLDEPTASVNPVLQERLLDVLRRINDEGTTIVLIEHDMNVVRETVDRVSVLNRGRIITQGTFEAVTSDVTVRDAYLGSGTEADATGGESPEADGVPSESGTDSTTAAATSAATTGGQQRAEQPGAPDLQESRLVATDVVTGYGNHTVVDGASVQSRDGVTCIFGPNGSGKSTLLKAMAGVLPVWGGQIEYDGRSMTGRDAHEFIKAGVAMVPQRDMIFGGLTVRENLQLGATVVSDDRVVEERIESVLDAFPPLGDKLSSRAGSLSGGQQTMLGFGRAMMSGGDVYLLDEPTSSLAPSITDDIFGMVERLVEDGAQVVLVEQNVREALSVADHVYILAGGTIQFDGPPERLHDDAALLQRFLGIE